VTQRPAVTPDIYYAPTSQPVAEAMLQLAGVGPADLVVDLGSGDGRIVIIAAQKYGARGVGVEIDPTLVARSRQNAIDAQVADRVTFIEGNLFDADLREATVVTMWLTARVNADLEPKFRRELRRGARIVSHQFPMGRWTPDRHLLLRGEDLFLWVLP